MTPFESFQNPDQIYRGMDFFMLNGKLEDAELIRQLDGIHEQGVHCVLARTYIGLQSDYPGPDFKARIRTICERAKEHGMTVFLQAGYMPEHVLDLPEKYSLDYIRLYPEGKEIPEGEEVITQKDGITYTVYHSGTFLDLFNEDSVAFYLDQSYNKMWAGFEEYFGTTVPSIWVDEPSYGWDDLPLPRNFFARFRERWGYSLEENVHKLYTDDEGYRTVRYHYRKLLQDRLEVCYFAMLRAWCDAHGLWASGHLMMEDIMETQIDRACAVMPYYRYFNIPGIDVLQGQMNWRHNPLHPHHEWLQDHMNSEYRPIVTTTPLQMTSVARQVGSEHILCEMYGVATQNMTFRHQKHLFDYMAMHGINHRSVHGMFYSMHGRSKRTYPPQVNYYQPYFKDLHLLYDYVASTARFVSIGKPDGDVLVVHPLDSAYCEYVNRYSAKITGTPPSRIAMQRRDEDFHRLLMSLFLSNCIFDLGDERTMEALGSVEGDKLRVGQMCYSTVVLPDLIEIQENTLKLLRAFSRAGGKVIVMGRIPELVDGFPAKGDPLDGINYVRAADHVEVELLTANREYSFRSEFADKTVYIRRRTENGCGYYFLFNPDCSQAVEGVLSVRGTVKAELWNGFTREKTPVAVRHEKGETQMRLRLPEGGSLMLVTQPTDTLSVAPLATEAPVLTLPLSNEWELTKRSHKNVLLLEFCSYKKGDGDYTAKDYPVLAVQQILTAEDYRGPLSQRFAFFCAEPMKNLSLALEDAAEHEIYLNGERVEARRDGYYHAKDFEVVTLGDAKAGKNVIEITRTYAPLSKMKSAIGSLFQSRTGCELESVYLLGDFAVLAVSEPVRNGDLRFSRHMTLAPEKKHVLGELTREGYPFYAGDLTLRKSFTFGAEAIPPHVTLFIEELNACLAYVTLNGKELGAIHSYPYEIDVASALRTGENVLEVRLVNTLRNLLGPYHNPKGEIGNLFGGGYSHQDAAWVGGSATDFTWFENRETDTKSWTDSYMQTQLNVKSPAISIYQK